MEKYIYQSKLSRIFLLAVDLCILYASFSISYFMCFGKGSFMTNYGFLFVLFCLSWWIVSGVSESVYRLSQLKNYQKSLVDLIGALCCHVVIVFVCLASLGQDQISQYYLISIYSCSISFIILSRVLLLFTFAHYKNMDYGKARKVVIVGAGQSGSALYNFFHLSNAAGQRFMGFFDDQAQESLHKERVKGGLNDLKAYCIKEGIDEIYFALPLNENKAVIDDLSKFSDDNFIYFRIVPDFSGIVQKDVNMYFLDSIPVITIRKEPLEVIFNKILKRAFDIAFSSTVILVIFPFILPIIMIAIKLSSKGPIFFTQMRPGKKNQLFKCYKFRTMRMNTQTEQQATKHDPRITNVGRFLRKTNLDELPQFFNVLVGDMSVVGPRPNMITQLEEYSKVIRQYKVRHFVNPGITGYAQVNGYRGETKQLHLMQKRVEYDVMYMENWSFFLDLKIIFLTVWNMIQGEKNAY